MKENIKKSLLFLLVVLSFCNIILLLKKDTMDEGVKGSVGSGNEGDMSFIQEGSIEKMSSDEILNLLQQQTDNSTYSISISSVLYFPNGTLESGVLKIENPSINRYNSVVTVTLDETDELVYTSPLLKPNQYIESMPLTRELEKGNYLATASFNVYSGESEDTLVGIIQAGVRIEVE